VNPGTPPSVPTGLTATAVSSSQINLAWNASTGSVVGYNVYRGGTKIGTSASTTYQDSGLSPSTTYTYNVSAFDGGGFASAQSPGASATTQGSSSVSYGLEWPGDGSVRRMLYWHNPFPIYDATYIFRVYPRKKIVPTNSPTGYYTTFFWGNDGTFIWDNGNANTYYGAHPYPVPPPNGPGQWEISVYSNDYVTGTEVQWDRWYIQAFRAWRESPSITHQEFYYDLPDTSKVITKTIDDPTWASQNPPTPAIVIGQAPDLNGVSWGGYPGWEEFNGIIRGIQIYSGLLSVSEIQSEIATPGSTANGRNFMWYLNIDPQPSDVTDKKGMGTAHNPSWSGTTALEWTSP
jgi:Fibronectin type III domain